MLHVLELFSNRRDNAGRDLGDPKESPKDIKIMTHIETFFPVKILDYFGLIAKENQV